MIITEESGNRYVTTEGSTSIAYLEVVPSLGDVLRQSEGWIDVFKALEENGDPEDNIETMIENAKDKLNMVACETVHKLASTGMGHQEIADDTGLSKNYVLDTMEVLGIEAKRLRKENDHGQG